jgi:hypothetical protein
VTAMTKEITLNELNDECVELLPARETLTYSYLPSFFNWQNASVALNVNSPFATAQSAAYQFVW